MEFKNCPFCNGTNVEPNSTKPPESSKIPRIYWINCQDCGATGSESKTPDEAAELWNNRKGELK